MFDRIEAFSETGFRGKSDCIEERLLVANLLLDETAEANMPLAIINLDLSKAFDKVKWDALWKLWLLRVFSIICFGFPLVSQPIWNKIPPSGSSSSYLSPMEANNLCSQLVSRTRIAPHPAAQMLRCLRFVISKLCSP